MGLLMATCSWLAEYKEKRKAKIQSCPVHNSDREPTEKEKCNGCEKMKRIRIFYSSRAHYRVAQAVLEYRKLPFFKEGSLK